MKTSRKKRAFATIAGIVRPPKHLGATKTTLWFETMMKSSRPLTIKTTKATPLEYSDGRIAIMFNGKVYLE